MQGSGLSLAQFGLMAQIAAAHDDTLSELAQRTGLDQSTLSRNLQVLEAAGLIEIAAGDRDARRRAVWLTEKGARSLEAGLADWRRAHGELAKRLDPEAARRLAWRPRRWRRDKRLDRTGFATKAAGRAMKTSIRLMRVSGRLFIGSGDVRTTP